MPLDPLSPCSSVASTQGSDILNNSLANSNQIDEKELIQGIEKEFINTAQEGPREQPKLTLVPKNIQTIDIQSYEDEEEESSCQSIACAVFSIIVIILII